ncbi:MAG TPA: hypothetical protein VFU58_07745 [Candidatus Nitrosotalea sp.]|nr:hypothetical protein [Candidatus Nitrosotalea sp.]
MGKSLVNTKRFTILVAWVLLGFIVSFIFANVLVNGKTVTPESFSITWGMSMVVTFSLGIPILVLAFRWEKRKRHTS